MFSKQTDPKFNNKKIMTLDKKEEEKKSSHACDKSSTIYNRIPFFGVNFYIIQKYL